MTAKNPDMDRPAAIRRALRDLVAERGFHGASMSAVAKAAGVATGTAYVHYESKEDLVYATYLEVKQELADAAVDKVDHDAQPRARYYQLWHATYDCLRKEPKRAGFLSQLEESPFYPEAHRRVMERGDRLIEEANRPDLVALLVDLPGEVLWSLSLGLAVRLVASGITLTKKQLDTLVHATWRAITARP
jgi:TetR/AcrR family transcriptional repressor of multidrug resistance operon